MKSGDREIGNAGNIPAKRAYRAVFERDDNDTWFVRVPEVQGVHSFGRTLARADKNIQEALALVLDVDEDSFELERAVKLAPDARAAVAEAQRYRDVAALSQTMASVARTTAVNVLSSGSSPLGLRDIAELVGSSFQRIQQIRANRPPSRSTETSVSDDEAMADVVPLMTVLNASVDAARRIQHSDPEGQDWPEALMTAMAPGEVARKDSVLDFTDALRACVNVVRRNLAAIPWAVGVVDADPDTRVDDADSNWDQEGRSKSTDAM